MRSIFYSVRSRALFTLVLSLLILTTSGCGKKTGTVSGTVTIQGKKLPGGRVNFLSEGANATVKTSEIKSDGTYSVSGLPVGPTKITVQGVAQRKMALAPGQEGAPPQSDQATIAVPPQYGNADQSGLTYDVQPGAQEHPIELK